jgi:predicted CXXCH cytochrome family protein
MWVELRLARRQPPLTPVARPLATAIVACALAAGSLVLLPVPAFAQDSAKEEIETCQTCHSDDSLTVTFADGQTHVLKVDEAMFAKSVHGENLKCTDCHAGFGEIPHAERQFKNLADFRASFREACKTCHFDNYTQSLDGVHYALLSKGDTRPPFCADCHGSHAIQAAGKPRTAISKTCARCHAAVSATWANSVHGKALIDGHNDDVPVCTDCHRSHDIADPRSMTWLLKTPELCGKCHTNKALMDKYGLSSNVLSTYLSDFHGMSASLSKSGAAPKQGQVTALCIDCHGVHNITRVDDPSSPVLKANLVKTCQKCHAGAPETFPAAWLSHYEPSWQKAPIVYSVKLFYTVFIPFIIGGLVLQILLHLWRLVVNR